MIIIIHSRGLRVIQRYGHYCVLQLDALLVTISAEGAASLTVYSKAGGIILNVTGDGRKKIVQPPARPC